jgi:RimJ/RimL family protein N-acetyltransferase
MNARLKPDSAFGDLPVESEHAIPSTLRGRRVFLRPPEPQDLDFLYNLSLGETTGFRWRFRGQIPSRETFEHVMWHDVLAQFVVVGIESGRRIGLVVAYAADIRSGTAYIGQLMDDKSVRRGVGIEAASLFLNYLFNNWNLRKLYGEAPAFTMTAFKSGAGKLFRVEGILSDHIYYGGRFWDQYIIAHYREDWERLRHLFAKLYQD